MKFNARIENHNLELLDAQSSEVRRWVELLSQSLYSAIDWDSLESGAKQSVENSGLKLTIEPIGLPPATPIAPEPIVPAIGKLNAAQAIALINKQEDVEILTLMADAERSDDNRRTVLDAIAKQIEEIQAKSK